MSRIQYYSTLFAVLFVCSNLSAERIPSPEGVFYYQPASSVTGFEAVWVDPSALVWYRHSGFQLMFDYGNSSFGRSWGTVVNRRSVAIGYRYLDDGSGDIISEYIVATGMNIGKTMALGVTFRRYTNAPDRVDYKNSWGLSFASRSGGAFQWSAQWLNLNGGKYRGVETETEQRYSISYKLYRNKVIFSVDAFFSTGQKFTNADFVYHLETKPINGLYVDLYIDSQTNFGLGVRANITQYIFGLKGSLTHNGKHDKSTYYFGATDYKQPSLTKYK